MRRSFARAILPTVLAVALGCGTETKPSLDAVVIEVEPGLGQRLDLVRVVFTRLSEGEGRVIDRVPSYERDRFTPITVRLSPGDGDAPGELYRVRAEGIVGTDAIVAVQHRIVFVSGRRIVLPFRFAPACVAVRCGEDTTCDDGRCVSDLDAVCAMDAGIAPDVCTRAADASAGDGGPAADGGDGGGSDGGPPPPGPDGAVPCASCDDGVACTDDRCLSDGTCTHAVDDARCSAGELCFPPAGCTLVGCADDAECADGDGCTTDRCVGGGCAHETIRCPRPGRCVAESCDPAIGRCVWSPLPDGTPCDLGLCCGAVCIDPTVNERGCGGCGSICGSGTACIAGACRACMGSADCDDRLACTMDSCVSGSCVRIPVDGCAIDGTCFPEGAIDPTNPCRSCQPAMRADAWTSLPGGTSCDDGSVCTEGDRCSEGRCIGGPSVDCSDGDACTEDACSEAAGGCTHTVVRSHCVIDGACYGEGQSAPFDTCLVCAPSSDPRGWTRRSVCH